MNWTPQTSYLIRRACIRRMERDAWNEKVVSISFAFLENHNIIKI